MRQRKINVRVKARRINVFLGAMPVEPVEPVEPAQTDTENNNGPKFIYDRQTILELGEILADLALKEARLQLQSAKPGKRTKKVN